MDLSLDLTPYLPQHFSICSPSTKLKSFTAWVQAGFNELLQEVTRAMQCSPL